VKINSVHHLAHYYQSCNIPVRSDKFTQFLQFEDNCLYCVCMWCPWCFVT